MKNYPYYFPADLQEMAEALGKEFDLERKTEAEIQQYWELWQNWRKEHGNDPVKFAKECL